MPKVIFIDYQGSQQSVDAQVDQSLMEAAVDNDVAGIDADCGGACACATCHVYIDQDWLAKVGLPEEIETEMLSVAEDVQENSRLSCQVMLTEEMDGLIVTTPESQY